MDKGTRSRSIGNAGRVGYGHVLLLAACASLVVFLVAYLGSTRPVLDDSKPQAPSLQAFSAPSEATVVPSVTATPENLTPIATSMATSIAATREAYATEVGANLGALRTSVALTQAPTDVPGPPSPVAAPTPMLGILPGCSNTNAYEPQAISCWRGVVDGQLVDVDAGREGRIGDMDQGILRVYVHGQQDVEIYNTPSRVGAVRIVSVSGTLFTLSTVEPATPQIFIFDLATRQWFSP